MKALVFHPEKCTGCKLCQLACSGQNEGQFKPTLSRLKVSALYKQDGLKVEGRTCNLCLDCVRACPNGAIQNKKGRLTFEAALCTDCGLCVSVCPNNVIIKKEQGIGICIQCRICVSWCPREALTFREVSTL